MSIQYGYTHYLFIFNDIIMIIFPQNYVNVTSGNTEALKVAIAKHGPVSVGIDASHKSLSFYSSGVYYEPKCGNTPDDLVWFLKLIYFFTFKYNGQK